MRLWHEDLLRALPRQQLLGQHRECCALRGNGWGKPHATVNYVFEYPMGYLVVYHTRVIDEMKRRGYNVDANWLDPFYRGKEAERAKAVDMPFRKRIVYDEHDDSYLQECILNLKGKGIELSLT